MLPTGTKGPPAWAPHSGHVEPLLSRFVSEPGLKVLGFIRGSRTGAKGPLEPGQMGHFLLVPTATPPPRLRRRQQCSKPRRHRHGRLHADRLAAWTG